MKGINNDNVEEQINAGNPWYVGSQFEWANRLAIRPMYQKRFEYFVVCIEKAKSRLGPNLRLLDAGCGDGYWLARLNEIPGLSLTGIDYNPVRIERARQAAPKAHVQVGDLNDLRGQEYDIILLNQVIEHVPEDMALLQVLHRLIRPQGVLILGTPNEGSWLQQRALRRTGALAQTDHVHFYTEEEIRGKITRAGFVIDSVMREIFYIGDDRLYYWLAARRWGFKFLELMTWFWPSECSDFYFECRLP